MLWAPPGYNHDANLVRALTRPGMHARPVSDDLSALAAMLSGLTTTQAAAMASGKPVAEHRILLVVEPAKLPFLRETLETLSRYISQVTLWVFDPSRPDSLRSMNAADLLNELAESTREKMPKVDVHPRAAQPHAVANRNLRLHTDDDASNNSNSTESAGTLSTTTGSTAWAGPWTSPSPSAPAPAPAPAQPNLRITPEPDTRSSEKPTPPAARPAQVASAPAHVPTSGSEKAAHSQARERVQPEPASPEPLLTDEELQMLLGDDPPASAGRKG